MWWVGALAGCPSPCEDLAQRFCGTCADLVSGSSGNLEVACTCLAEGRLTQGDAPEGYFESDEAAAIACDNLLLNLHYVGEDGAATCRAGASLLDLEEAAACEEVDIPAFNL